MDKFLGIGLVNAMGLWLLFMLLSIIAKTVANKYPIEGLTEFINVGAQKGGVNMLAFITKPSWWIQMLLTTFVTMLFIVLIKNVANKFDIPIVKDMSEEV